MFVVDIGILVDVGTGRIVVGISGREVGIGRNQVGISGREVGIYIFLSWVKYEFQMTSPRSSS